MLSYPFAELFAYSVYQWIIFIGLTAAASYRFGIPGLLVAHLTIAVIVFGLDHAWLDAQMAKPDWDGLPDRDIVFSMGIAVRVVLINTVLLPVGILAMYTSGRVVPWTTMKEYREQIES